MSFVAILSFAAMAKEVANMFGELKREPKQEFKDLWKTLDCELRKEIRQIKNSLAHINKDYEDMKNSVNCVKTKFERQW